MTKLAIFISIAFGFSFFYETPETPETLKNAINNERIAIVIDEKELSTDALEIKSNAYESYLQELNIAGPKEGSEKEIFIEKRLTKVVVEGKKVSNDSKEETEPTKAEVLKEVKENSTIDKNATPSAIVVDHKAFGTLLNNHVDSKGNVDYAGFKTDKPKLEAYINKLTANPVTKEMGKNERLAYWINLYNALTIKLIIDNYPVKSITDLEGGKPWDKLLVVIGSTSYSLNNIENDIIRKRFTEPRIHFAVNCAAKSCPPILNDAFYPNSLTNQLAARTKSFLEDSKYNTVSSTKLEVSKIFDWYGKDFGNVKSYIQRFTNQDLTNSVLTFKEYDWALNKK